MRLYEYQAKKLLAEEGIPVPRGREVRTPGDAARAYEALHARDGTAVLKAQVQFGGRGKAGGIRRVRSAPEAVQVATELIGATLTTAQGSERIAFVLAEEALAVERELYAAILIDRNRAQAVLLASARGGVEIEELAKTDPSAILTTPIDLDRGLHDEDLDNLGQLLGLDGASGFRACFAALARCFAARDLLLLEINPLAVVGGALVALDAKVIIDDNALFRQKDLGNAAAASGVEAEARAHGLSWVDLGGDIACLVNGAGLAMATADAIHFAGGTPANFLDIGGAADRERLEAAFHLLLRGGRHVHAVLVNVFGGIVRCDLVARALTDALAKFPEHPPIVVRLEGTNIEEARRILSAEKHAFALAQTVDEAASMAVAAAHKEARDDPRE